MVVDNFFPFPEATSMPKDFQGNFLRHKLNKVVLNSFLALKEFNKLRDAALFHLSLCVEVVVKI